MAISEALSVAVMLSPELRGLILHQLVLSIRRFSDVREVLRVLTLCTGWRKADATLRDAIECHWTMSSYTVLNWLPVQDAGIKLGIFMTTSSPGHPGICTFPRQAAVTSCRYELPCGLPELFDEMVGTFFDQTPSVTDEDDGMNVVAHADGVKYACFQSGGVARIVGSASYSHGCEWPPAWAPADAPIMDEDGAPHLGITVGSGFCFITEHMRRQVIALDAQDLTERFAFGRGELDNPVDVAWQDGRLWVADASSAGRLVAYSFGHGGPRVVHTIEGIDHPVGVAAAHGRLYIACGDECTVHSIIAADYTEQGSRSSFESVPHDSHVIRGGHKLCDLAVHPELPLAVVRVASTAEDRADDDHNRWIAVLWSKSVLGCGNYHDAYQTLCGAPSSEETSEEDA